MLVEAGVAASFGRGVCEGLKFASTHRFKAIIRCYFIFYTVFCRSMFPIGWSLWVRTWFGGRSDIWSATKFEEFLSGLVRVFRSVIAV